MDIWNKRPWEKKWKENDPEGAWQEWQAAGGNRGQELRNRRERRVVLTILIVLAIVVIRAFFVD